MSTNSLHHDHSDLKGIKLVVSILLNLLITVAQAIGGFISGSLALLSDALHNFSDVIALVISYIANRLTSRKFTQKQTFGYKRAEIIAAMINAIILIAIAINLAFEAIDRFSKPIVIETSLVIILAGFSILVNLGSVLILRKDASHNLNIKSAYLHLFSDMVTSMAVLAGGLAMKFWQVFWVDSMLSMLIACFLVYSSWGLLIRTLKVLMQFAPPDVDLVEIKSEILKFPEIENIHHIHIWQLNDKEYQFEAHIDFKKDLWLSEVTRITVLVEKMIKQKFHISHTVIQQEFGLDDAKQLIVNHS